MKKCLIWVIAIAAVLICAGLMGIKICRDRDNPIRSKIAAIDSAEIIGCYIGWPTLEEIIFHTRRQTPRSSGKSMRLWRI